VEVTSRAEVALTDQAAADQIAPAAAVQADQEAEAPADQAEAQADTDLRADQDLRDQGPPVQAGQGRADQTGAVSSNKQSTESMNISGAWKKCVLSATTSEKSVKL